MFMYVCYNVFYLFKHVFSNEILYTFIWVQFLQENISDITCTYMYIGKI